MLPGRSNSLFGDIQGLNRVEEGTDGERRNAKLRRPFYVYVVSLLGFLFTSTYLVNPAGAPEERLGLVRGSGVGTSSAYGDVAVAKKPRIHHFEIPKLDFASKPKIAVAMGATSRHRGHLILDNTSLVSVILPSLEKTMETDRFKYKVFVGIDDDDKFWNNQTRQHDVKEKIMDDLDLVFHSFPQPKNRSRIPFNEICQAAYDDGADYIVRMNDDSEFLTQNWTSMGVKRLLSYAPPNVGVVGPTCKQGNEKILTHDMVHRTHIDIFGFYYPPSFRNWYVDDWITKVYGETRTLKLKEWEVKHHLTPHRYNISTADLEGALIDGKQTIKEWLAK